MFKKIGFKIKKFTAQTIRSIAFYPVIISICFVAVAGISLAFDTQFELNEILQKKAPFLFVNNIETARSLLTVLIAGVISLMVFSFSMVMVLLNQASSSFSPRLLPGLISNKRHQIVLGYYLGTILFCILILLNIDPHGQQYKLPSVSVLLCLIAGIASLGMFIYFIHSISEEIQVSNILKKIHRQTLKSLKDSKLDTDHPVVPEGLTFDKGSEIGAPQTGYLDTYDVQALLKLAEEHKTHFKVLAPKGRFLIREVPFILSEVKLEEEIIEQVAEVALMTGTENVSDNFSTGFKHITEIAVKAMSPGINDPGTASTAINYLSDLFAHLYQSKPETFMRKEDGEYGVVNHPITFGNIIDEITASLRCYTKHDVLITEELIRMLSFLIKLKTPHTANRKEAIQALENIYQDAKEAITNEQDIQKLTRLYERINRE